MFSNKRLKDQDVKNDICGYKFFHQYRYLETILTNNLIPDNHITRINKKFFFILSKLYPLLNMENNAYKI